MVNKLHLKSIPLVISIGTFVILLLSTIFVMVFSFWQNQYTVDPHHAGLMLSNAKDLVEGKAPYREIFIQYGIMTTVIQAVAFQLFGQNLLAIILITAFAYALGLIGVFFIGLEISGSKRLALYAYISCVLTHELVIYPWSNYVAFPFIAFGALFVLRSSQGRLNSVWAGLCFGIAILCRENLVFPIFLVVIALTLVKAWKKKEAFDGLNIKLFWLSLASPLLLFLGFIVFFGLYNYWFINAVELPRLYASTSFMTGGIIAALKSLLSYLGDGLLALDPRLSFLTAVLFFSAVALLTGVLGYGDKYRRWNNFFIAFLTLVLLSSSLHLNEIFRLITGISLGAIFIFYFANKIKMADVIFIIMIVACWNTRYSHIGNNFSPLPIVLQTAEIVREPSIFKGQKWTPEVSSYYRSIEADFDVLAKQSCIKYLLNDSPDAFIAAISPFKQYQIAPFGRGLTLIRSQQFDDLRSDYDLKKKIGEAKDLLIIKTLKDQADSFQYRPPNGFYIYKEYKLPENVFFMQGHSILIITPLICKE